MSTFGNTPRIAGAAVKRAIPATLERIFWRSPVAPRNGSRALPQSARDAFRVNVRFIGQGACAAIQCAATALPVSKTKRTAPAAPAPVYAVLTGSIQLPQLADDAMLTRARAEHWLAYGLHEVGHGIYSPTNAGWTGPRDQLLQGALAHVQALGLATPFNHSDLHRAWNCLEDPRLESALVRDAAAGNFGELGAALLESLTGDFRARRAGSEFAWADMKHLPHLVAFLSRDYLPAALRAEVEKATAPALLRQAYQWTERLWALPAATLAANALSPVADHAPLWNLAGEFAASLYAANIKAPQPSQPQPQPARPPQPAPSQPQPEGEPGDGEPQPQPEGEPGEPGDAGEPQPQPEGDAGEPQPEGEPGDAGEPEGDAGEGDGEGEPGDGEGDGEPGEGDAGDAGDGEGEPGDGDAGDGDAGQPQPGQPGEGTGGGHGEQEAPEAGAAPAGEPQPQPMQPGDHIDTAPELPEASQTSGVAEDPLSRYDVNVRRVLPKAGASEAAAGERAAEVAAAQLRAAGATGLPHLMRRLLSNTDASEQRRGLRAGRLHVRSLPRCLASNSGQAFQRRLEKGLDRAAVVMALDTSGSMGGSRAALMQAAVLSIAAALRTCHGSQFGAFAFQGGVGRDHVGGLDVYGATMQSVKPVAAPLDFPLFAARVAEVCAGCGGGTPERPALAHAINEAKKAAAPRRFVLYFTDGDGFNRTEFRRMTDYAARFNVTCIGIGMESDVTGLFRLAVNVADMRDLAGAAMRALVKAATPDSE